MAWNPAGTRTDTSGQFKAVQKRMAQERLVTRQTIPVLGGNLGQTVENVNFMVRHVMTMIFITLVFITLILITLILITQAGNSCGKCATRRYG